MQRFPKMILLAVVAVLLGGCVSSRNRDEAQIHYTLGASYIREGNYSMALKELLQAERQDSSEGNIQMLLGQVYQIKKDFPLAEKHYLKALRLNPDEPLFQNNIAALYLDMERWDDAIRYFRSAATNLLFQTPEVSYTGLGYAEFRKGGFLPAAVAYKEALKYNPRYYPAHQRLAECYEALNKFDLAAEEYKEAITLAPQNHQLHYRLALLLAKQQKTTAAVKTFQEVVRLSPDSEEGRSSREYLKLMQ